MSDENDIDLLDLINFGKDVVKEAKSLMKIINDTKVEFDRLSHTREESKITRDIAANNTINTKPDIPGDIKIPGHPTNTPPSDIIDMELDSSGGYRRVCKQLDEKK